MRSLPPPQDVTSSIEGIYTRLLVVRDLASGYVLVAIPALEESAAFVLHVLESLFRWFGPPLVLKSDNGGPFIADEVKAFLRARGGRIPAPGLPATTARSKPGSARSGSARSGRPHPMIAPASGPVTTSKPPSRMRVSFAWMPESRIHRGQAG